MDNTTSATMSFETVTNFGPALLCAFVACVVVMASAWAFGKRVNNYSIVDAVWAYLFTVVAGIYAFVSPGAGSRKLLIFACVALWSVRLGSFLAKRIASHHPKEDARYQELREEYGAKTPFRFFWFYQYQAWSVVILSAPFLVMAQNAEPILRANEIAGAALFVFSWSMEALADAQKQSFYRDPNNKGKNCEVGLWKYSRHPNYFFESVHWWAFFLMALSSPYGIYSLYCPVLMLVLLLKVTGVPMSEKHSLKSKGDLYRDYQARVSKFVPWLPKERRLK